MVLGAERTLPELLLVLFDLVRDLVLLLGPVFLAVSGLLVLVRVRGCSGNTEEIDFLGRPVPLRVLLQEPGGVW